MREQLKRTGNTKFIDNTERDNEVKKLKEIIVCIIRIRVFSSCELGTAISKANE